MSNQSSAFSLQLAQMPSLTELFQFFIAGKHLNRTAEPTLWLELEQHEADYCALFSALGYELRIDRRGFAWFHVSDAASYISKTSRQLALLFMMIFDSQANAGQSLQRYLDWLLDRTLLNEIYQQNKGVLDAEEIQVDNMTTLLNRACNLGLAKEEGPGWRLLPAVARYLDHFEALASELREIESAELEHWTGEGEE